MLWDTLYYNTSDRSFFGGNWWTQKTISKLTDLYETLISEDILNLVLFSIISSQCPSTYIRLKSYNILVMVPKLYIPSTLNTDYLLWYVHTINCVCSKILNHCLNHGLVFSLFKFFGWKNILTSDALKIVPHSVMFYYCVWYDF